MYYLALCCIAKDEDPFLKEWLTYHSLLGVEHFFIYDNCSQRPIRETLGSFVDSSRVTIRRIVGSPMQLPAYDDCLKSFGSMCKWIGFIDLDEFVCPMIDDDLRVVLSEFEAYGGLGATWQLFNSSGHLKRPAGLVIQNYTEVFTPQESFHIKCFVQPPRTVQALSPHNFSYVKNFYCVNEDHFPISPGFHFTFSSGKLLRVNHYFMKSQQDFEEKVVKGRAAAGPKKQLPMKLFFEGIRKPYTVDTVIQRFIPQVSAALKKGRLARPVPLLPGSTPYDELMETAMRFQAAGQMEKASACLCYANEDTQNNPDYWTLRALLAKEAGNLQRAEIFLRHSLTLDGTAIASRQLRNILAEKGKNELAAAIDSILDRYLEFFH